MTNSDPSSPATLPRINKFVPLAILFLAIIGFLDATYLTASHYLGTPVVCSLVSGCERVLASPYSAWAGIPVALFGSLYYLGILVLAVAYLDTRSLRFLRILAPATAIGVLASAWFVTVQLAILKSLCLYCILSALTSTLLFCCGVYLWRTLAHYGSSG